MQRTLVIMLKEPRLGRVKTRLAQSVGTGRAAWWFRHQSQALIRRLGRDPRWRTVLAVSPDIEGVNSRIWPADLERWPQGRGSLGDRMARVFRRADHGPTLIIGADIPGITPHHIWRAYSVLGHADMVLGPAPDGGYWLVGLRHSGDRTPATIFEGVRWSTEHARKDTETSIAPMTVGQTDTLRDVDDLEDLRALGLKC